MMVSQASESWRGTVVRFKGPIPSNKALKCMGSSKF